MNTTTEISEKMSSYWTERSESYSEMVLEELYGKEAKIWEESIYQHINKDEKMSVLDVGTGPGLFAALMGKNPNYEVYAVDSSRGMIEQASKNAQEFGARVAFHLAEAHQLPFEDEKFDVIMMRNVTWALPHPKESYQEWKKILKKGGKLIIFDSNWYNRLFDEKIEKEYIQNTNENHDGKGVKIPDGMSQRMEEMAKELPLSKERRPAWDVNCLLDLGFTKIFFDYNINDSIYNEELQKVYAYAPMFRIIAVK